MYHFQYIPNLIHFLLLDSYIHTTYTLQIFFCDIKYCCSIFLFLSIFSPGMHSGMEYMQWQSPFSQAVILLFYGPSQYLKSGLRDGPPLALDGCYCCCRFYSTRKLSVLLTSMQDFIASLNTCVLCSRPLVFSISTLIQYTFFKSH